MSSSSSSNDPVSVDPSKQESKPVQPALNSNDQAPNSSLESMTGGASLTTKDNAVDAAGQTLNSVKEAVVDGAVPVAKETLQTAQEKLSSLVGGNGNTPHRADGTEAKLVDQMDSERVADFLRETHMSTKAPPSKSKN